MKTCPSCKKDIADNANPCPHCGKKFTSYKNIILAIILGLLIGGWLAWSKISELMQSQRF